MKCLSVFGFVTSVKHWDDWGGVFFNLWSISIFSCFRLSVFVESLESLCENHNVSFNVDSVCYSSLQILNLTKAISDQLKYIILLKLAMLELPCCSIVLSYLYLNFLYQCW
jgi:hypothetical protein